MEFSLNLAVVLDKMVNEHYETFEDLGIDWREIAKEILKGNIELDIEESPIGFYLVIDVPEKYIGDEKMKVDESQSKHQVKRFEIDYDFATDTIIIAKETKGARISMRTVEFPSRRITFAEFKNLLLVAQKKINLSNEEVEKVISFYKERFR